jgi:large subunit ribosomal protein L30
MTKKKDKPLKITLTKSVIGQIAPQKATVKALGLRKLNHTVYHSDTPVIRGMINRIAHLVRVEKA